MSDTNTYKKFLVVAHPRSGSANLCEMLNAHKSIECGREILNRRPLEKLKVELPFDYNCKINITKDFLGRGGCFDNYPVNKAIGFKIFPWHLDLSKQYEDLKCLDVKYIYLRRDNIWDTTVSLAFARTIKKCHLKTHESMKDFTNPVHIPKERFSKCLRSILSCYAKLDTFFSNVPHLRIDYKDGQYSNIESVFNFLNVEPSELIPQRRKINVDNFYEKYITNYAELKKYCQAVTNN